MFLIAKQLRKHKSRQTIQGGGFNINGESISNVSQTVEADAEVNISGIDISSIKEDIETTLNNVNISDIVDNINVGGNAGGLLGSLINLLAQLLGAILAVLNSSGVSGLLLTVLGILALIIRLVLGLLVLLL